MSQKINFNFVEEFINKQIVLYLGLFFIFISVMFLTKDFGQAVVFVKNIFALIKNFGILIFLGGIISALMYIINLTQKLRR